MANIKAESNTSRKLLLTSQELRDTLTDVFANLSVDSLLNLRLTNKHLKTAVDNFVIQTLKQEFPGELESLGENPTINNIILLYKQVEPLIECKEYFSKLSNSDSDKILKTHCLAYLICKYPSNTKPKDYFIENGADLKAAEELLQSLKVQEDLNLYLDLCLANTFTWDSLYLLKTILLLGADFGKALKRKVLAGKTERVKLLLAADKQTEAVNAKNNDSRTDGWTDGWTALILAAKEGHTETVQTLLTHNKIDINAKNVNGETALMWAARNGRTGVAKSLLAHKKIKVNAKDDNGYTALMVAAIEEHTKTVQRLLKHNKIDINAKNVNGETALMGAAYRGRLKALKALLEHNEIEVNAKNKNGWTALMWAAYNGHTEAIKALLEHNEIEVNAKGNDGYTALMYAANKGHTEAIKALLTHSKIEVNAKGKYGQTALIWAAFHRDTEVIKALLAHNKIDINAKNENGKTALMEAARQGYTEAVKALLGHNEIDVDAKDKYGNTALMYAARFGHTEVVNLLKTHIANKAQESQIKTQNTKKSLFSGALTASLFAAIAATISFGLKLPVFTILGGPLVFIALAAVAGFIVGAGLAIAITAYSNKNAMIESTDNRTHRETTTKVGSNNTVINAYGAANNARSSDDNGRRQNAEQRSFLGCNIV